MTRWFDRTFSPGLPATAAPDVFARLRTAADRLDAALRDVPPPVLTHRRGGRWSIQEQAGHLLDLEPLWQQRLEDFDTGQTVMRAADLENRKTHEAHHNGRPPAGLLAEFRAARASLVARLDAMSAADLMRRALHPRLQQQMSVLDLCDFVARHDDHHLASIAALAAELAPVPVYALDLLNTVDAAAARLAAMDDERTRARPAPGKWSPREVIGHLVDSASNNHQRFVRAMFQDDLVFQGYAQDDWVAAQKYQDAPWDELVTLWAAFNRHLARVMAAVPAPVRERPHGSHNLDRMAFNPVPAGSPATLGYFMEDYVRHLQHHLRQIA